MERLLQAPAGKNIGSRVRESSLQSEVLAPGSYYRSPASAGRQGKNHPYEEAIRTAFFLRYPRLAPLARSDDRFALNIDLAPTFAELAGTSIPLPADGVSLVRVMDGTAQSWRTDFMTEGYPANHIWASIRDDQWKYTEYPDGEKELYNLSADPFELNNVAGDPANADCVAAMAARIREIRPNWPNDAIAAGELPDLLD